MKNQTIHNPRGKKHPAVKTLPLFVAAVILLSAFGGCFPSAENTDTPSLGNESFYTPSPEPTDKKENDLFLPDRLFDAVDADMGASLPLFPPQKRPDAPAENPIETPTETPAEVPENPPVEPPTVEVPTDPPVELPVEKPIEKPVITIPETKTQVYLVCTGENVNLRSGAGTAYSVIGVAEKNNIYPLSERTGNWCKTYYKGRTAYISGTYTRTFTIEKGRDDAERVIAEGYKLLGTKYLYGATRLLDNEGYFLKGFTAELFDCSSLIQYIFYKALGIKLGTTTRIQVGQGKHVDRSELRRGDCIYFTNASRYYNTGLERVGHVALYLGDGYILHTASDYARIEKMNAQRENYYIEARRFY